MSLTQVECGSVDCIEEFLSFGEHTDFPSYNQALRLAIESQQKTICELLIDYLLTDGKTEPGKKFRHSRQ